MSGRRNKDPVKVKWSLSSLEIAFKLVQNGVPIRKAARDTVIPFSTLQERLKNKNQQAPRLGRNTVFNKEQETAMADQIKLLAKIFYGCTSVDIRKMAYAYAGKNGIPHNFNKDAKMAGRDWLNGFLKRNKLSSRKAEGTSINRAIAFNKQEVTLFFNLLEKLIDKYKFLPRNIYNVDETGVSSVQDPGKIIAEKGQKRVGSITTGERGKTVTAVCAMSATGNYIPPMLIYPRQRHSKTLKADGPRGAIYRNSKNGWINEDLFVDWLKHFAEHTKPSENEPILLILDNHSSHISLGAYEFCKANNIVMLSLPPHGSHRIQPMDVSVYGPLKTAYKQECNLFMKSRLGCQIAQTDIASLFRKAFQKVATIPKAESGFATTGIYPYNPEVFTEEDFLAAEFLNTTDQDMRQRDNQTPDLQIGTRPDSSSSSCSTVSESLLDLIGASIPQPTQSDLNINSPIYFTLYDCVSSTDQSKNNAITINSDVSTASPTPWPNNRNNNEFPLNDLFADTQSTQSDSPTKNAIRSTSVILSCAEDLPPGLPSGDVNKLQVIDYANPTPSCSKEIVTAKDLIPIPKQSMETRKRRKSRKQHAIVITGTPHKEALMEKENRKLAKINKNVSDIKTKKGKRQTETKKIVTKTNKIQTKREIPRKEKNNTTEIQRVKKKVLQGNDSKTSNSDIDMVDLREDNDTDIDEDYLNKCLICEDYGRDYEMWYRCVLCGRWAHQECSGYDSPENYICDLCVNRG